MPEGYLIFSGSIREKQSAVFDVWHFGRPELKELIQNGKKTNLPNKHRLLWLYSLCSDLPKERHHYDAG